MSEMMSRVALAIQAALGTINGDEALDAAGAALRAAREPTEAMIRAGVSADYPGGRWGEPTFRESTIDEEDAPVIWQAMIDAALAEGNPNA